MPVTLKDVAARAGVSPVVVSRVLHNKALSIRVSEPTAVRVREAARDLNYKVNMVARNLRNQSTQVIGILHGNGHTCPQFDQGSRYFASLMDGIVSGAFEHHYSVMLCPALLGDTPLDGVGDGRFDGLIWYSSTITPEFHKFIENCDLPMVLIHAPSEMFSRKHPAVICDNLQGMRLAIEHLHELGHTRIGMLHESALESYEMNLRLESFHQVMAERGLRTTHSDIVHVTHGRQEMKVYLANPLNHTALVSSTEGLAADFVNLASEFNVSIPEQLSVIGFDSTSYCNELRPTLTAVYQPLKDLGNIAVQRLLTVMKGSTTKHDTLVLPCGLDIRGSTTTAFKTNIL